MFLSPPSPLRVRIFRSDFCARIPPQWPELRAPQAPPRVPPPPYTAPAAAAPRSSAAPATIGAGRRLHPLPPGPCGARLWGLLELGVIIGYTSDLHACHVFADSTSERSGKLGIAVLLFCRFRVTVPRVLINAGQSLPHWLADCLLAYMPLYSKMVMALSY